MRSALLLALALFYPIPALAQADVARAVVGEVGWTTGPEARLVVRILRGRARRRGMSPDRMARLYSQPLRDRSRRPWVAVLPVRGQPWPEGLPRRYAPLWRAVLGAVRRWLREPYRPPRCGAEHWAAPWWPVGDDLEEVDCGETRNRYYRVRRPR